MILELESVTLRPWDESDIGALVRNANDRKIWLNLRDRFPHPYTRKDAEAWITLCSQAVPTMGFAIVLNGEAIGGIGLEPFEDVYRQTAEIGYWLGVNFWGRGIMTQAIRAVTRYAFEHCGIERVQAGVFDWNPTSARVLEKAGYSFEGRLRRHIVKDGRVGDVLMYSCISTDPIP